MTVSGFGRAEVGRNRARGQTDPEEAIGGGQFRPFPSAFRVSERHRASKREPQRQQEPSAGTAPIERTLKLNMEGLPTNTTAGASRQMQNTLSLADSAPFAGRDNCVKRQVVAAGASKLRQLARVSLLSGIIYHSDASPSRRNLLFESFSARASAPRPVSLDAFHQALGNTSDVSLL